MKLNCTVPSGTKQPSADIAGYGVMISATILAITTISSVIYAYLSDSMPQESLNEADKRFIASMNSGLTRLSKTSPGLFCGRCLHWLSRTILRRDFKRDPRKLSRQQRETVATRFILSLSDQQLIFGLSILVAITSNQSALTVAEFRIAFALAWLSVTTHLATLDALQQHFLRHVAVRNLRVIGMVILMILFVYCFVIFWFMVGEGPDSIPVNCYLIRSQRKELAVTDIHRSLTSQDFLWVLIVACIPYNYAGRILRSYDLEFWRVVKTRLAFFFCLTKLSEGKESFNWSEWKTAFTMARLEEAAHERRSILESLESLESLERKPSSLCEKYVRRLWLQWRLCDIDYRSSMISASTVLSFTVVFGSLQTRMTRWVYSNFADLKEMGFGQITPLILLFIPLLTGLEGYYEASDVQSRRSRVEPRSRTTTSSTSCFTQSQQLGHSPSTSSSNDSLENTTDVSYIYDTNPKLIRRYCFLECLDIAFLCRSATTEKDYVVIAEKKMATWSLVYRLSRIEDQYIHLTWSWLRPILGTVGAIGSAVLIIFGPKETTVLMHILIFRYVLMCFISWLSEYWLCFEEYTRILEEVRNGRESRMERNDGNISLG